MMTSNRGTKGMIFTALNFTNDVNEKGAKVQRTAWSKDHYRAVASLSKKLQEDQEVIIADAAMKELIEKEGTMQLTQEDLDQLGGWKPWSEVTDENRTMVISARYTDKELDLTDKEVSAIKHFWKDTDEVGNEGLEALDEMERIVA